jgi:hypothetical protein
MWRKFFALTFGIKKKKKNLRLPGIIIRCVHSKSYQKKSVTRRVFFCGSSVCARRIVRAIRHDELWLDKPSRSKSLIESEDTRKHPSAPPSSSYFLSHHTPHTQSHTRAANFYPSANFSLPSFYTTTKKGNKVEGKKNQQNFW